MDESTTTLTQAAVRLVCKGLRPNASGLRDAEYARLLARYGADPGFREVVDIVAEAMELRVLDVDERCIVLAASSPESIFAPRMSDLRKNMSTAPKGVAALAMVAIAATYWPLGASFAVDANVVGPARVSDFVRVLRSLCESLRQERPGDPVLVSAGLEEAWRHVLDIPVTLDRKNVSHADLEGWLASVVKHLAENGQLHDIETADGKAYLPTPRFRIQVRELAAYEAFRVCMDAVRASDEEPRG